MYPIYSDICYDLFARQAEIFFVHAGMFGIFGMPLRPE